MGQGQRGYLHDIEGHQAPQDDDDDDNEAIIGDGQPHMDSSDPPNHDNGSKDECRSECDGGNKDKAPEDPPPSPHKPR